MGDRETVVETETSGEYGEQVIVHGKTAGGVYKPIYIGDDGKVKIDPVPPDVNAIADEVESRLYCSKDATPFPKVYPKLANAVAVSAGAGVWSEGAYVDLVPANGIQVAFHMYGIMLATNDNTRYPVLTLGWGSAGSETEFAEFTMCDFYESSVISFPSFIRSPANLQVRVKIADNNIAATTYAVKLLYVTGL